MTYTYVNAVLGKGVDFAFTPAGGSSTTVTQVLSFDAPTIEMGQAESSALGSGAKEYVPTIYDGGELGMTLQLDFGQDSHTAITTALMAGTFCSGTLTFPAAISPSVSGATTHTYTFTFFFTSFQPTNIDLENEVQAEVKAKITGPVTIT